MKKKLPDFYLRNAFLRKLMLFSAFFSCIFANANSSWTFDPLETPNDSKAANPFFTEKGDSKNGTLNSPSQDLTITGTVADASGIATSQR